MGRTCGRAVGYVVVIVGRFSCDRGRRLQATAIRQPRTNTQIGKCRGTVYALLLVAVEVIKDKGHNVGSECPSPARSPDKVELGSHPHGQSEQRDHPHRRQCDEDCGGERVDGRDGLIHRIYGMEPILRMR